MGEASRRKWERRVERAMAALTRSGAMPPPEMSGRAVRPPRLACCVPKPGDPLVQCLSLPSGHRGPHDWEFRKEGR